MNTGEARPGGWPWGLIALLLALLAWAGLFGAGLAFAASMGSPGDGNHGMQAMQYWILAALLVLGGSLIGSVAAAVLAWRRRRGPICATVAMVLLTGLAAADRGGGHPGASAGRCRTHHLASGGQPGIITRHFTFVAFPLPDR